MEPLSLWARAQLAAQAGTGGLALTAWPWMYRSSAVGDGRIKFPLAGDGILLAEIGGTPTDDPWIAAVAFFRGDPKEPTRARFEARALAREIHSTHYAFFYGGWVEGPWSRTRITLAPGKWLDHVAATAGLHTTRWFTTATAF